MGHLGGINKVAWDARLLPMSTSARAMVWAHCGCFCQLPNKQLGCLDLVFPETTPYNPTTLPLYMTLMIIQKIFKNQLFQLAVNFVHIMLAITSVLVQIWRGYNQPSVNCSVLNISNWNTKCDNTVVSEIQSRITLNIFWHYPFDIKHANA